MYSRISLIIECLFFPPISSTSPLFVPGQFRLSGWVCSALVRVVVVVVLVVVEVVVFSLVAVVLEVVVVVEVVVVLHRLRKHPVLSISSLELTTRLRERLKFFKTIQLS